jgi:hypothetical protein
MSQPVAPENLNIRVFTQSGPFADITSMPDVRFAPEAVVMSTLVAKA